jgi:hypothetical protein
MFTLVLWRSKRLTRAYVDHSERPGGASTVSFRKKELARLSHSERERFEKLQTEAQGEAFFLCRSFAKLKSEFPLSQASLADRLSVTRQGAGYVIARLIELGAIKKTAEAKPHSRSACYRWTAQENAQLHANARFGSKTCKGVYPSG